MAEETVERDDESAASRATSGLPAGQPGGDSDPESTQADSGVDETVESPDASAAAEETREDELIRERDDYYDKWLRAVAELDNLRKRTRRELADGRKFAIAELVRSLLEIQDDLERALAVQTDSDDETPAEDFRAGVALIYQNFRTALTERGVRRIEAQDRSFDPALHEAVGQLDRDDVPSGTVLEVVQQGYTLDDLVIRPSRVIVAKGDE